MKTAAIILNSPEDIGLVTESDIVCADGGYKHLFGIAPVAIVGDLDSLDSAPEGVPFIKFPVEKNETDGQLAIDYCADSGYNDIVIYGALGGRIEHILGNLGLLAYAAEKNIKAVIKEPDLTIELLDGTFTREVKKGDKISFYPFGGDVTVRHSSGLYYPLENLHLAAGANRGVSNIATDKKIGLDFDGGRLLYIRYFN